MGDLFLLSEGLFALKSLCTEQDHPAPVRQRARCLVSSDLSLEKGSLIRAQQHRIRQTARHRTISKTSRINDTDYGSA